MHTPDGFTPTHALPLTIAPTAHVFAFRGDKVLVIAVAEDVF